METITNLLWRQHDYSTTDGRRKDDVKSILLNPCLEDNANPVATRETHGFTWQRSILAVWAVLLLLLFVCKF